MRICDMGFISANEYRSPIAIRDSTSDFAVMPSAARRGAIEHRVGAIPRTIWRSTHDPRRSWRSPPSDATPYSRASLQFRKELVMNNDRVAGAWHQIKGKVKEQWGKLTDDDLRELEGHGEQLAGKLQERYGLARDAAERQAKEFRTRHNWN
jgi:uncharacterized protein YjbJ (UPF0337 family)